MLRKILSEFADRRAHRRFGGRADEFCSLVCTSVPDALGHRDIRASNVRLRVAEAGSGSPLILVHGMFADYSTWDQVVEQLSDDFRIAAPDLPGFGASEKPPSSRFEYGINGFANAIADLYAGLGLGRAALVGHGLGGAAAIAVAARYPELVSRLVLVDSVCYDVQPDVLRRVALAPLVGGFVFKQLWGRATFRSYFKGRALGKGTHSPERIDRYYEAFNSPAARGSALATLRNTKDTRSVVADTSRIQAPTLVIWGRHDRIYPAGFGQRLAREIRGAGFELIDSGHSPQEEQPRQFSQVLRRFLLNERPSGA